ncbi:hypothetical protein [Methanothermobacter tenebrarum]
MIGRLPGLIAHINEEAQEKPFRKTLKLEEIQYHGKKPKKKLQNQKINFSVPSSISTQKNF